MQLAKQKPGYQQTEVGVIPADWELKPLGEFAQFRNGLNFIKSDRGDLVKVVGVADFQSHFSVTEDHLDSVQIGGSLGSDDLLKNNDLLFVRSNGNKALIGRCVLIQGFNQPVSFSGFTIRGRVSRAIASPEYIARYFHSNPARRQIKEAGEGSHISNLSQQVLASLKIPLPKLAEQEAIAAALSDADGLIESLEKLIAKKRQVKHGTMQELLSGHHRLPGFSSKWETKRLGGVVECLPSGTYGAERDSPLMVAMPVATTAQISNDDRWNGKVMQTRFFTDEQVRNYGVLVGDLVVVKSSGSAASIQSGKMVLVDSSLAGTFLFSNFLMRLRPKAVSASFLYFFLTSTSIKAKLPSLCEASTYPNIRINEYLEIDVPVPSIEEQSAIASILTDMDAEIAGLEGKLAKARQVKQGMMQELLTGRTRLI